MLKRKICVNVEVNDALRLALRRHLEAMEAGCAEADKEEYTAAISAVEEGRFNRLAREELTALIMLRAGFSDVGRSSVGGWSPDSDASLPANHVRRSGYKAVAFCEK